MLMALKLAMASREERTYTWRYYSFSRLVSNGGVGGNDCTHSFIRVRTRELGFGGFEVCRNAVVAHFLACMRRGLPLSSKGPASTDVWENGVMRRDACSIALVVCVVFLVASHF